MVSIIFPGLFLLLLFNIRAFEESLGILYGFKFIDVTLTTLSPLWFCLVQTNPVLALATTSYLQRCKRLSPQIHQKRTFSMIRMNFLSLSLARLPSLVWFFSSWSCSYYFSSLSGSDTYTQSSTPRSKVDVEPIADSFTDVGSQLDEPSLDDQESDILSGLKVVRKLLLGLDARDQPIVMEYLLFTLQTITKGKVSVEQLKQQLDDEREGLEEQGVNKYLVTSSPILRTPAQKRKHADSTLRSSLTPQYKRACLPSSREFFSIKLRVT